MISTALASRRGRRVERDLDVPGVERVLAEAQGGQAGSVHVEEPEELGVRVGQCGGVEGLVGLDLRGVGDDELRDLFAGAARIPGIPDRLVPVGVRLFVGSGSRERGQADLGAAAEVRADLGDGPVVAVRGGAVLFGIETRQGLQEVVVGLAQHEDGSARISSGVGHGFLDSVAVRVGAGDGVEGRSTG